MFKEIYYEYLNKEVYPQLKSFEQQRINNVNKILLISGAFLFAGLLSSGLFFYLILNQAFNPVMMPVILFLIYFFFLKSITIIIDANKTYKEKILKNIFPLFLKPVANFKKWPESSDIESIIDANILGNFEIREDKSCLFGVYKNVNITLSETKLTAPVEREIFNGIIVQLELPFSINNHITMMSKNEPIFVRTHRIDPKIDDMNNFVYLYAQNAEKLNIIDEKFWSAIKKMSKVYLASGFALSINNNSVVIALRQKKSVQFISMFNSLFKPSTFDNLIEHFTVIFEFIDLF